MSHREIKRLMVVDDDVSLSATLKNALGKEVQEFRSCFNIKSALETLQTWTPDLLILDLTLPDGDAFDVLVEIQARHPTPLIIAISGTATPDASFDLARQGVHTYLPKPFGIQELRQAIDKVTNEPLDLKPQIKAIVGQHSIRHMENEVRNTMLDEAVARADGNRTAAARLLKISRQLIQHMLRQK